MEQGVALPRQGVALPDSGAVVLAPEQLLRREFAPVEIVLKKSNCFQNIFQVVGDVLP